MILSVLLNYTNPTPSGHWKPMENKPKNLRKTPERKLGLGAFLQAFLVAPVFQTKRKFLYRKGLLKTVLGPCFWLFAGLPVNHHTAVCCWSLHTKLEESNQSTLLWKRQNA